MSKLGRLIGDSIREFFGYSQILERQIHLEMELAKYEKQMNLIEGSIRNLQASFMDVTIGDELSPERKRLSDEVGRRIIKRLEDNDKARRHTLGEL